MTRILTLVVASILTSQAPAQTTASAPSPNPKPTPAQTADAYYAQGQAAEKAGDPTAARQAYEAALRANPKHAHARFQLGQVKLNATRIAAGGREATFGAVVIPEFNIADATLTETLAFLSKAVDKQSEGKVSANFVIQDSKNTLGNTKINLQLKNAPARAIMKYLMDQVGAKARYDEFAIVIIPLNKAESGAPEKPQP